MTIPLPDPLQVIDYYRGVPDRVVRLRITTCDEMALAHGAVTGNAWSMCLAADQNHLILELAREYWYEPYC